MGKRRLTMPPVLLSNVCAQEETVQFFRREMQVKQLIYRMILGCIDGRPCLGSAS